MLSSGENSSTSKKGKYRTVLEVQAPSKITLRLAFIFLDFIYFFVCAYGLNIYRVRYTYIHENFSETTLLSVILPMLSSLGFIMIIRLSLNFFLFILIPYWSIRDQRKIFMKLGGGLYANAKFPMLKYRDYVLQL